MARKVNPSIIAQRYAKALLELALEKKAESKLGDELSGFAATIDGHDEVKAVFASPLYGVESKKNIALAMAKTLKTSPLFNQFIGLVADNQRLDLLQAIARQFQSMLSHMRGEAKVQVELAKAISKAEETKLAKQLEGELGKKIEMDIKINPSLIGGMKLQIGSKMLDASVKSELERMRLAMKGSIS